MTSYFFFYCTTFEHYLFFRAVVYFCQGLLFTKWMLKRCFYNSNKTYEAVTLCKHHAKCFLCVNSQILSPALWGADGESEMQEGRVLCPRLHALINVELPAGGQWCSSSPNVFLNYSQFPFFQPGLVFCSSWFSGSWQNC